MSVAVRFVAATIVCAVLAACGGEPSPGNDASDGTGGSASPEPSTSSSKPPENPPHRLDEQDYKAALDTIPVEGTDDAPIDWSVPDAEHDAGAAGAVRAVQQYYALDYYRRSLSDKNQIEQLAFSYVAVAADELLDSGYHSAQSGEGNGLGGPVWIKVTDVRPLDKKVGYAVTVCEDFRKFHDDAQFHNVRKGTGVTINYVQDVGEERFKVYTGRHGSDKDVQQCRQWAKKREANDDS